MLLSMTKPWYKSKTKVGVVVAGVGGILTTVGLALQEKLDIMTAVTLIIAEIGAIWCVVGARDAIGKTQ